MKYENYTIEREDHSNWKLLRFQDKVYQRDFIVKGKLVGEKGCAYTSKTELGFFGSAFAAVKGIIQDKCGEGCDDLKALSEQLESVHKGLEKAIGKQNAKS